MTAFTNDSIDELDRLAHDSGNVFNMTRGGYILATRKDNVDDLVATIPGNIDVDVVSERQGLHTRFPALDRAIQNVIHIRRGGDISGQQLGQYLLNKSRGENLRRITGDVVGIESGDGYKIDVRTSVGTVVVAAPKVVNAAGPFAKRIAAMIDVELPQEHLPAENRL